MPACLLACLPACPPGRDGSTIPPIPRTLIASAVLAVLLAGAARAQVTGPIPNTGYDTEPCCFNLLPDYDQVRSPQQRELDRQIEIDYRAAMRKIPDKKPSNDPWKGVRATSVVPAYDRHRPQ